jgi:L-alanine-DL-glutamate epimerase-like enolase superfamily enzyme
MATISRSEASLINYKLGQAVGGSGVAAVDVIVVEIEDNDGASGLGFSYVLGGGGAIALQAAKLQLESFVQGFPLTPPRHLWQQITQSFNRLGLGVNLIALAAIDTAVWDLHARRQNVPLGVAMGGKLRAVPVYGSGGFNAQQEPRQAADTALGELGKGFKAVKLRVSGQPQSIEVLWHVRRSVGEIIHVMADANEKCDLVSAHRLMSVAKDVGLLFLEEPLPAHAYNGYRALKAGGGLVPIATGEHMQDLRQMVSLMSERIVSVVQPDLAMIGGLSPALDLAHTAELLDVTVSPHFLPGIFAHLAAASSSVQWLEDFPLLEPLFDGWPMMGKNGTLTPDGRLPGHGIQLSEKALRLRQ